MSYYLVTLRLMTEDPAWCETCMTTSALETVVAVERPHDWFLRKYLWCPDCETGGHVW